MRALAEFILRGRLQAGAVALLGYLLPLLTPVTVALVTLRKGAVEGTSILLLGLSPALLSIMLSGGDSLVLWITLLSLITVYIPAVILRITIQLPLMMLSAIFAAMAISGAVMWLAPNAVDSLVESLMGSVASASNSANADQAMTPLVASHTSISGMIAYILAFNGLTAVFIGRWLQALVFNPGGFGQEFRALRLGVSTTVIFFLGSLLLRFQGEDYLWWSNVLAIPLLLVALSIAHSFVKARQLQTPWLVLFYFAAMVFMPVVVCIGFADAWVNFRDRFKLNSDPTEHE